MKEIILKNGMKCLLDDSDYEVFSEFTYHAMPHGKTFYARRGIYDKALYLKTGKSRCKKPLLHREILGIKDPKISVDHVDGNGLNNQRLNLRVCTHRQNCANRRKNSDSSHKFKGVRWRERDRIFEVSCAGKWIGSYREEKEAALAYNCAASFQYREFARLNKIQ